MFFHLINTVWATIFSLFQCIGLFCLWCHVILVGDTQSFTAVIQYHSVSLSSGNVLQRISREGNLLYRFQQMASARWKTKDLSPQPAAQSSFKKIMVDWNLNFCPAKSLRPWWKYFPSLILTCPLKVVRYWGDWDWDTSTSTSSHLSHPCYLSRPSRFSFRFRDNGGDGDKSSYKLSVFSLFPIIVFEVVPATLLILWIMTLLIVLVVRKQISDRCRSWRDTGSVI